MYCPVARAMALGATSSRRYATAITEAPNNEIIMTLVRPMTSLIGPTKSSAIPRVRVVTLTDSAADPAVTPECALSRGSSG